MRDLRYSSRNASVRLTFKARHAGGDHDDGVAHDETDAGRVTTKDITPESPINESSSASALARYTSPMPPAPIGATVS